MVEPAKWKFRCEWKDEIPLPPEYTFPRAFNYLNPETNSFYILEKGNDYLQCGGSKEKCTVELREYAEDGSFRHYLFFDPSGSDEEVHVEMSEGGVNRKAKHCFDVWVAIKLFSCYFNSEPWPQELQREDITDQFR
jgi:hypothetical protein